MPEALTLDRNTSKKIGVGGLKALYVKKLDAHEGTAIHSFCS